MPRARPPAPLLLALLLVLAAAPLHAQRHAGPLIPHLAERAAPTERLPAPPRLAPLRAPTTAGGAHPAALLLVGLAATAAGAVGGASIGYGADRAWFDWGCRRGCEDPGVYGATGGWYLGSAALTPLAVHLVNGERGSLERAYAVAGAIAAVGWVGHLAVGSPGGVVFLLGAPLAQAVSATVVERYGRR